MPAARCCAATARSRRRSCSARSTSAPTSPGRAPRSTSPGHSDVLAGVVTTRDAALRERLVWTRRTIGGVLAPDPAWLLLRGLRTLHVRAPAPGRDGAPSSRGGSRSIPRSRAVHYPGLAGAPGSRARAAPDAGRRRRRARLRAGRRARRAGSCEDSRAARALRDQPRRRRDADRAPGAHGAGGPRARGPAAALRRPRGRRRPLGRSHARRCRAAP